MWHVFGGIRVEWVVNWHVVGVGGVLVSRWELSFNKVE